MRTISFSRVFLFTLLTLSASAFVHAQTQPTAKPEQYFFVLLNHPVIAPQLSKEAGEKLQEEHMANIGKDGSRTQTCDCRTFFG